MPNCPAIDSLLPGYVDEQLADSDRLVVERHLAACRSCRAVVATERAVRELVTTKRADLRSECAPASLKTQCLALVAVAATETTLAAVRPVRSWRARLAPLAAAAVLVLVVGGAFVYEATARSSRVMAAELAADHVKCFAVNAVLGTHESPDAVENYMASGFGWTMQLPAASASESLEVVGSRPCLYGEGKVAHIMYRHQGRPVSLFMLPRTQRPEEMVEVLGHQCAIWSDAERTFVLVGRESSPDFERLAAYLRRTMP